MHNILNMLKRKLAILFLDKELQALFDGLRNEVTETQFALKASEELIRRLEQRNDNLEWQLNFKKHSIPVVGFDEISNEPSDTKARRQYCADVKIFHDNILQSKIKGAIAETRNLLSNMSIDSGMPKDIPRAEYDAFLRGMEAGFWSINDWAERLSAELVGNNIQIND